MTKVSLYAAIGAALVAGCATQWNIAKVEVAPVVSLRHGGAQAEGYYEMGRYYQAQGRSQLAVDAYRKALSIDDRYAAAHDGLGIALASLGQIELALAQFSAAIAVEPDVPRYYNNLGYAYHLLGRQEEAVATLQKAASLDPANPRVWNNLASTYAQSGNPAGSQAAALRATEAVATAASAPAVARSVAAPEAAPAIPAHRAAPASPASPAWTPTAEAPPPMQLVQLSPFVFELRAPRPAIPDPAPIAVALPKVKAFGLEVANGNGVTGMARRLGELLAAIGSPAARLTNQKPFTQQSTVIQYRASYEDAAAALRGRIPGAPALAIDNALRPGTDVRLVLGKDLPANVALLDPATQARNVAAMPPRTSPEAN